VKQVLEILDRMIKMTVVIDGNVNYSQQIKDESKRILNYSLDYTLKESDPQKINQLVYAEFKKLVNKKQGITENNQ